MSGEVVVITGASAGVGRATAREFARHGARVALLARGQTGLEATRKEVEDLGGEGLAISTDVASFPAVDAAAAKVEVTWGPIDVWINNAMTSVFSPVKDMTPEEFARVTNVTYLGAVHGTLAALRRMLTRNKGVIVQVGSALAYRSIPLQAAYCASKHALAGFTEALRTELLHDGSGVRVSQVHLPAMNTPQFGWVKSRLPRKPQPVPPIFQPEVAARALYFAAHHDRRELRVGFPTWKAVVGNKLVPGILDHYLARTGYQAQQTDEPADPQRPSNLWQPVPGDHGAHGSFGARSRSRCLPLWLTSNNAALALVALAAGTAFAFTAKRLGSRT